MSTDFPDAATRPAVLRERWDQLVGFQIPTGQNMVGPTNKVPPNHLHLPAPLLLVEPVHRGVALSDGLIGVTSGIEQREVERRRGGLVIELSRAFMCCASIRYLALVAQDQT